MPPESLARVDALIGVALRIAQRARSGRVALAQLYGAIDPAWLSPRSGELLALMRDADAEAREPLALRAVERVLRDAWGAKPSEELDELDPDPVAVTPGSQVHRGVVDGQPVAVKVLRPGLAASVRQDLTLLEALAAPLRAAFPQLDAGAVLAEVRERVLEELDLESEAGWMRRFHRALRDHPWLSAPAPIMRLCHEHVLVSGWLDGVPFAQAPDPDRAAAQLLTFVFGSAHWGVAYADVDGENVLVTADGGLAIVDFGACREVDRERLSEATGVLDAVAEHDAPRLGAHLDRLGWLPAEHAPEALALAHAVAGEHLGAEPSHLDVAAVAAARARLVHAGDRLAPLLPQGSLAPADLWPGRGVAHVLATIARRGATAPWALLARRALAEGWDALPA